LEDLGEEFGETFVLELYEQLMEESSSSLKRVKVGSSRLGQRYIYREREGCDEQLYQDYFGEDRTFDALKFRHRFRMGRELFLYIV
jgi:hypothetical protein